jgi:hypothetical protein
MLHQSVRAAHAQALELGQSQPELCIVLAQVSLSHFRVLNRVSSCIGAHLKSQNMRCSSKKKVLRGRYVVDSRSYMEHAALSAALPSSKGRGRLATALSSVRQLTGPGEGSLAAH